MIHLVGDFLNKSQSWVEPEPDQTYKQITARLWLNLQTRYDLEVEKDRLGQCLEREVTGRAV